MASRSPRLSLVDAHAHLADPCFDADRTQVLERARMAGVARIVVVGETLADAQRILALADAHSLVAAAAGLQPTHLDPERLAEMLQFVRERADALIAVGEIGLDHWLVKTPAEQAAQREAFLAQVRLARDLDLPVNVHSRSAGRETIEALVLARARRVLLHAFDGKAGTAAAAVAAGFFFSVPPSIRRSRQKQKLFRALPWELVMLETDSPVLGPVVGERNEPANVRTALTALAELKGVNEIEAAERTTANAVRLFGEGVLSRGA